MKTNQLANGRSAKSPVNKIVSCAFFPVDHWFTPSEMRTFWKCIIISGLIVMGFYSHTHRPNQSNQRTKWQSNERKG